MSSYVVSQLWGQSGADKYLILQVRERMEFTDTSRRSRHCAIASGNHRHTSSSGRVPSRRLRTP